jgi:hypothetical protein
MKKKLLAGLAAVLFFLTSTGIAMAGDDAKNKADGNNSKTTGLYDNVRILQEQIDDLERTLGDWPLTQEDLDEIIDRIRFLEGGGHYRFTDMGDGTIRDNDSGLIWLKKANCFEWTYWSKAMDTAAALESGKCELTDGSAILEWRLPTKAEWEAFMSPEYEEPALADTRGDAQWLEGDAFTGVQSFFYWTSDVSGTEAWFADTRFGLTDLSNTGFASYIWPVRSGK